MSVLRIAPHDLKIGDIMVSRVVGIVMRFYRVVGVPSPRTATLVQLPDHRLKTSIIPLLDELMPDEAAAPTSDACTYKVRMMADGPWAKLHLEIARRWDGQPVQVGI